MKIAVIVSELAGVSGVDDAGALIPLSPSHGGARARLRAEVDAVSRGLRARGVEEIRIVTTLDPSALAGAEAVVALGMHAGHGDRFAAHYGAVFAGSQLDRSAIVTGWAADAGVPLLLASGADEPAEVVPWISTKRSLSRSRAVSRPLAEVEAALETMAREQPSVALPRRPGSLEIHFKRRWQTDLAVRLGAERLAEGRVKFSGATFTAALRAATAALARIERPFMEALSLEDSADLERALEEQGLGASPIPRPGVAEEAFARLLALTAGAEPWQIVRRARVLHMLEAHAPAFASRLPPALVDASFAALDAVATSFPLGLPPQDAFLRLHALHVRHERRLPGGVDTLELSRYVEAQAASQPILAWKLGDLAAQIGAPIRAAMPSPASPLERVHLLVWEIFADTRGFGRPLPPRGWETHVEALAQRVPSLLAGEHLDLAAEVALCMQSAGESEAAPHHALVGFLAERLEAIAATPDRARTLGHTCVALARLTP